MPQGTDHMTTTTFNQGLLSSRSLPAQIVAVHGSVRQQLKAVHQRLQNERARRCTARILAARTDQELDDLGLHRGQLRIERTGLFD
ncbi:Hypothetical protein GbCGDNIH2_2194 [Granulibacter bethesdensis]|uniref:YjiS-like domain-containing protein n=3 Tax=Granulibacter bethesdensis TaxID=364410 RepID=Q0BQ10_GRABC|nr:Hypothetical protein GbCGDNIH1_2194 [Granulibacter bethesdensis CGDNIH1]AHJ64095.1 Hypothetical protein GbCGDNIH3_2194 [Granulibacter bethesdensis]AHJ67938.1 Hypothetical protein GbCGDNIH2_2194 [Granulibacter bethesdensis]APH52968.1 Hypothetical protein GbCGDNIH5_2194 [Granulibacter bethesdensis]APH58028.1 Hypothetical protein GbCGDNIH6_2194 [Granulibacter bethesdensis]